MAKNTVVSPEKKAPQEESGPLAVGMSQAGEQNTPRNIGLIIVYEYKKRLSQRSFKISTAIILILILLGSFVPTIVAYVSSQMNTQKKVVVVNTAGPIAGMNNGALLTYIDRTLNATTPGQNASGKPALSITMGSADASGSVQKQVKDGTVSILLVLERAPSQDVQFTYYTNANPMSDSNVTKVQGVTGQLSLLDRASRLGLTPDQTSHMFAQPQFTTVNLGAPNDRSQSDMVAGYVIAYVGIMLIFMSIYLYGYGVAMGVAEEKGSRIMEILVNAATPFQLMAGKILGIGAAGLTQMTAFVVVGIGALLLQTPIKDALLGSNTGGLNLNITSSSITLLLLLLVYFILGFLLYASLFAATGALVKRQEEVQNAVQIPMWLFLIGYLASIFGLSNPNAMWVTVMSFVPFWTPTTMLMRVAMGSVTWLGVTLSIVLMIAAIVICTVIAARIYRYGVLMYGQKPGMRQLVKLARMK
ncbi:MAG: ABC transporter permease [Ktedonobacteraceae bacterium]